MSYMPSARFERKQCKKSKSRKRLNWLNSNTALLGFLMKIMLSVRTYKKEINELFSNMLCILKTIRKATGT